SMPTILSLFAIRVSLLASCRPLCVTRCSVCPLRYSLLAIYQTTRCHPERRRRAVCEAGVEGPPCPDRHSFRRYGTQLVPHRGGAGPSYMAPAGRTADPSTAHPP